MTLDECVKNIIRQESESEEEYLHRIATFKLFLADKRIEMCKHMEDVLIAERKHLKIMHYLLLAGFIVNAVAAYFSS